VLYGRNNAVDSHYLLGWSQNPGAAKASGDCEHSRVLLWHANYHPDGGQLFFPLNGEAFVCPLALPGDDIKPADFVAFYVDSGKGLYIHPNVWHEAVFPLAARASFYDEQGKVHARVSCNIAAEFGVFLAVPLVPPR
jgi:ureidoglycolate lyase